MHLICVARAGLCNRIRTLLGAKSLADETRRELVLYWENSSACGCDWSDLFKPSVPVLRERPSVEFAIGGPDKIKRSIRAKLVEAAHTDRPTVVFSACSLGKPVHHFRHFGTLFRPTDEIAARVEAVRKRFADVMLGVHVRCGDLQPRERAPHVDATAASKEFFKMIRIMHRQLGAAGIFLASDDGASVTHRDPSQTRYYGVYEAFVRVFAADHIVRQETPALNRSSAKAIQDALVDLLLLRSCDALCGHRGSSFSQVAAIGRNSIMLDFQAPPQA
jgi:hypothetical protein